MALQVALIVCEVLVGSRQVFALVVLSLFVVWDLLLMYLTYLVRNPYAGLVHYILEKLALLTLIYLCDFSIRRQDFLQVSLTLATVVCYVLSHFILHR